MHFPPCPFTKAGVWDPAVYKSQDVDHVYREYGEIFDDTYEGSDGGGEAATCCNGFVGLST